MVITQQVEELTDANKDKNFTVGLFMDSKKAFNTIDYIHCYKRKLEYQGIRGVAQGWLKRYLTSREQLVSINKCNSDLLNIKC